MKRPKSSVRRAAGMTVSEEFRPTHRIIKKRGATMGRIGGPDLCGLGRKQACCRGGVLSGQLGAMVPGRLCLGAMPATSVYGLVIAATSFCVPRTHDLRGLDSWCDGGTRRLTEHGREPRIIRATRGFSHGIFPVCRLIYRLIPSRSPSNILDSCRANSWSRPQCLGRNLSEGFDQSLPSWSNRNKDHRKNHVAAGIEMAAGTVDRVRKKSGATNATICHCPIKRDGHSSPRD